MIVKSWKIYMYHIVNLCGQRQQCFISVAAPLTADESPSLTVSWERLH